MFTKLFSTLCVFTLFLSSPTLSARPPPYDRWNYNGIDGPQNWPSRERQCRGRTQSPVDLLSQIVTPPEKQAREDLDSIKFKWPELKNVKVVRKDSSIQYIPKTADAWIHFKGHPYVLDSFHYHAPSEHRIGNRYSDLEFHFFFRGAKNPSKILVVSVMFSVVKFFSHDFIKDIVKHIPKNDEELNIKEVDLDDLAKDLKGLKRIFTYVGSLTNPPCTQGVQWIVLEKSLDISVNDLKALRNAVGFSARPTSLGPDESSPEERY